MQEMLEQHDVTSVLCRSFFIPDDSGKGLLVLNKEDGEAESIINKSMDTLGIKTAFIYAHDGARDVQLAHKVSMLKRSPWFWCSLTAVAAVLFYEGLPGLFWLSFWGSVGWFSSRFIMSRQIMSWISSWRASFGKNQ
ncbi:MAG: hypothetical protein FWE49_05630 [Synergistaceae bacterium]|nr:hypothetical protein [Synergistaceae bacterium]